MALTFPKINRRKLARAYDWALITVAPAVLSYLLADKAVVAWLTENGPWVLPALGVVNIVLNRLPKLPPEDPPS